MPQPFRRLCLCSSALPQSLSTQLLRKVLPGHFQYHAAPCGNGSARERGRGGGSRKPGRASGRGGQTAWAALRIPVAPGRVRDARGEPREGAGRAGQGTGVSEKDGGRGAAPWGITPVTEVSRGMPESPVSGNLFIHGVKWHLCVTRPVQPAWSSAAGPDAVM